MSNYPLIFATLGAELKNSRKAEAVFEDFHYTSLSTYAKRLVEAQYDLTDIFQSEAQRVATSAYESAISPGMQNLFATLKAAFEQGWFPVLDSQIDTNPSDKASGPIAYAYDGTLNDGTISILSRGGRWGALRNKMIADRQVILKNTLTFGSLTPVGTPIGTVTLSAISGSDHTLAGVISLICIDDTVGATKFQILNTYNNKLCDPTAPASSDNLSTLIQADNPVTVGRSFQDGPTGLTMLLNLGALTVTDPQNIVNEAMGFAPTVFNPNEQDTNKGNIYIRIIRQSADPVWHAQYYKDAAFTQLVGDGFAPHDTPSFFVGDQAGTQVVFNLITANADIAMPLVGNSATFVISMNLPRLNDQYQITVGNAEDGLFATKIAHRYRATLNSAAPKPSSAPSAALAGAGAGNVNNGTHAYTYSYIINGVETGESAPSGVVTVVDHTVNGQVSVTGITTGPSGTTARRVYRTIAGNTGNRLLVATIADNVTTTLTDNIADGSLGVQAVVQTDDTLATSVSMT